MDLSKFLNSHIQRASVPGQGVFARDLYNTYASERLAKEDLSTPPLSFTSFVKSLKGLGYCVDRNRRKYRHGWVYIHDVVMMG